MQTKQTAFRLTETDFAIIDRTRKRLGFTTRTETVRYILRQWQETVSFAWDGNKKGTKR